MEKEKNLVWKRVEQALTDPHYDAARQYAVILQFVDNKETLYLQRAWPCRFVDLLLLSNPNLRAQDLLLFSIEVPRNALELPSPKDLSKSKKALGFTNIVDRYDLLDSIVPPHLLQPCWTRARLEHYLPSSLGSSKTILECIEQALDDTLLTSSILFVRRARPEIQKQMWSQRKFLQCKNHKHSRISLATPPLQSVYYHKMRVGDAHTLRFVDKKPTVKLHSQPWFWCESCSATLGCEQDGFWECKCSKPIVLCGGCVSRQNLFPTLWDECLLWQQRRHDFYRDNYSTKTSNAPTFHLDFHLRTSTPTLFR